MRTNKLRILPCADFDVSEGHGRRWNRPERLP
jgi:hypothetical protein